MNTYRPDDVIATFNGITLEPFNDMRSRLDARMREVLRTGNNGRPFPKTDAGRKLLEAVLRDVMANEFPLVEFDWQTLRFDAEIDP